MDVGGYVAVGFEAVREAFAQNFATRSEVGAACAVYRGGQLVVDVWGGVADPKDGRPWDRDTLALVYSTTKGVTAICAHHLAQRGGLDLDAPVVRYWPEFGVGGKDTTTVRDLLAHRAGVPTLEPRMGRQQALEWDPPVAALAAQSPLWEPGTAHGYHAVTFGWLVGEVIRRASGRSVGAYLAEEVAGPLGLDLWIGLPASEESRVARLVAPAPLSVSRGDLEALTDAERARLRALADPDSLLQRALNPTDPPFSFNRPDLHAAQLPAANGIGTARSLARLYAATLGEVDGFRVLDAQAVAGATSECSAGLDRVLGVETRFGSGFFLSSAFSPMMGHGSFGHSGAGGSLAFADPETGVGFAYVMNQMQQGLAADPRPAALVSALRHALTSAG